MITRKRDSRRLYGCYTAWLFLLFPLCLALLWSVFPQTWAFLVAFADRRIPGWKLPYGFFVEALVVFAIPIILYDCLDGLNWLFKTQREREQKSILWILPRILLILLLLGLAIAFLKYGPSVVPGFAGHQR